MSHEDPSAAGTTTSQTACGFEAEAWCNVHLYYHGDQDAVLAEWVAPMVRSLARQGAIERFFYLRYRLGGPHLRLRFHPLRGAREVVESALEEMADSLFRQAPSSESLDPETIARENRSILSLDSGESDTAVYPDNSWRSAPFVPELDRFGGPELYGHCADVFTTSSLAVLDHLEACRPTDATRPSPAQRFAAIFQRQAGLAWSLASDPDRWLELLGYAGCSAPAPMRPIVDRGDKVFEKNRPTFVALLLQAIERAVDGESATESDSSTLAQLEQRAGRQLVRGLGDEMTALRKRLPFSLLHLGANRLGQSNPDEVYLSRLLWRAAQGLSDDAPDHREKIATAFDRRETPRDSPREVTAACLELFGQPG